MTRLKRFIKHLVLYSVKYWAKFSYAYEFENRKRYVNRLIDSAKVVQ
jgi:hypothetical protein